MTPQLPRRLVIEFKSDGIHTRVLYKRQASPSEAPNPGTVRRRREAAQLIRRGLERTLAALDAGDVADLGTSGFTTREDVLGLEPLRGARDPTEGSSGLPLASRGSEKQVKRGA